MPPEKRIFAHKTNCRLQICNSRQVHCHIFLLPQDGYAIQKGRDGDTSGQSLLLFFQVSYTPPCVTPVTTVTPYCLTLKNTFFALKQYDAPRRRLFLAISHLATALLYLCVRNAKILTLGILKTSFSLHSLNRIIALEMRRYSRSGYLKRVLVSTRLIVSLR